MTWTAIVLILVMMVAGSKLARHSLTALAAMASIGALVWFLAAHTPEPHPGASHASLTSRPVP
jgi:amino acid permease